MPSRNTFVYYDIEVTDEKIDEYAKRYIDLLLHGNDNLSELLEDSDLGFDTAMLGQILRQNVVPSEAHLIDIYKSDLGEMLMTHFFEEEISNICKEETVFTIPLKNISHREISDQPARGIDAIGYRDYEEGLTLLLGEAKVSEEAANPPQVVHRSNDSMFNTQKKYHSDKKLLLKRLSEYYLKLRQPEHLNKIGSIIIALKAEGNTTNNLSIIYGCCLVRDKNCFSATDDYGKLQSEQSTFEPHSVFFVIPNFSRPISEVVSLFKDKVKELSTPSK